MTTPTPFDDTTRDDVFNDGLERLLAGDLSGLEAIEADLHDTVLEMTGLACTAGWLDAQVTPSGATSVRDGEDRTWQDAPATLPALNGHVPPRTASRATGPREVTMQATAIPATPPISHRTRERGKPAITRHALRFHFPGIANAAMVVLVVLSGFGAWRVLDGGEGNGPAPSDGHYALAPMTPVPDATAPTGNAATACDFSEEVPIYNGIDEPPVDGTVLYVTTSHLLMLHCDEKPEDVLLAKDVKHATATHWPGVVNLGIGVDKPEPTTMLIDVMTNESAGWGHENPAMRRQGAMFQTMQSPFFLSALPDDAPEWALTDLRSMETRSLSALGGVEWPRNSDIYVADNGAQGTYAIAVFNPSLSLEEGPALIQPEGFPGEIMLVSGSMGNITWIDVPPNLSSPYSIYVSPDGAHVAVMDVPRPESQGQATIAILDASDGAEVARTDTFDYAEIPDIVWVNDGSALVYPQSGALMMLSAKEGSAPQPLLESEDRLFSLKATYDPGVVTISESGVPEREWQGESDRVYAVNTRTGSVETFEGRTWQPGSYNLPALQAQSAIILVDRDESASAATRVIDPATGKVLIELPIAPSDDQSVPGRDNTSSRPDTLATSVDRGTVAFTIRNSESMIVASVSADQPGAREIPFPEFTPPAGDWSTQVDLSPDGSVLLLTIYNTQASMTWTLDLISSGTTWQEVPDGTWVTYMPAMP